MEERQEGGGGGEERGGGSGVLKGIRVIDRWSATMFPLRLWTHSIHYTLPFHDGTLVSKVNTVAKMDWEFVLVRGPGCLMLPLWFLTIYYFHK